MQGKIIKELPDFIMFMLKTKAYMNARQKENLETKA